MAGTRGKPSKYDIVSRGRDSSGRPLRATRQAFQHFDRVNEKVGGKLVIVQSAFIKGTAASAGTHDQAGCLDIRTWNLTAAERNTALKEARRLGAAAWYRSPAQGFDPHIHWVLIGDAPMASLAKSQIDMYRKGYNGLGWYAHKDDFPYRPRRIRSYRFKEDDMFEKADRDRLIRLEKNFNKFRDNEYQRDKAEYNRDAAEAKRDKQRYDKIMATLAKQADRLTVAINSAKDDATKNELRKAKTEILNALKDDPEVRVTDNPTDDGLAENE